ncbi:MAG: hypothetical protein ACI936_004040 [Paraglaciecola sp.]|jgi:hypothetical protein
MKYNQRHHSNSHNGIYSVIFINLSMIKNIQEYYLINGFEHAKLSLQTYGIYL